MTHYDCVMNKRIITPPLQAPGAGLPLVQALVMKYYYGPFVSKREPWDVLEKKFIAVYSKVIREIDGLNDAELNQVVLIKPLPGIEDSSRNWSIAMTLEHLLIVGEGIKKLIIELSHGRSVPITVDIAKFKPLKKMNSQEAVAAMLQFRDNSLQELQINMGEPNSPTTHVHPWFGPFRCLQWFWLLVGHGYIHTAQIREIKKGLLRSQ